MKSASSGYQTDLVPNRLLSCQVTRSSPTSSPATPPAGRGPGCICCGGGEGAGTGSCARSKDASKRGCAEAGKTSASAGLYSCSRSGLSSGALATRGHQTTDEATVETGSGEVAGPCQCPRLQPCSAVPLHSCNPGASPSRAWAAQVSQGAGHCRGDFPVLPLPSWQGPAGGWWQQQLPAQVGWIHSSRVVRALSKKERGALPGSEKGARGKRK